MLDSEERRGAGEYGSQVRNEAVGHYGFYVKGSAASKLSVYSGKQTQRGQDETSESV